MHKTIKENSLSERNKQLQMNNKNLVPKLTYLCKLYAPAMAIDSNNLKEYRSCKMELEYITSGIILRSKTIWYGHGNKSSKYFLNLEKRYQAKSHLHKLITCYALFLKSDWLVALLFLLK